VPVALPLAARCTGFLTASTLTPAAPGVRCVPSPVPVVTEAELDAVSAQASVMDSTLSLYLSVGVDGKGEIRLRHSPRNAS